jgi:hypothetical protein
MTTRVRTHASVLKKFSCRSISYEFSVPKGSFDWSRFYEETGLEGEDVSWGTVFEAKRPSSAYHVHFNGNIDDDEVTLTLVYYDRSRKATHGEPFSETVMSWIGSFFRKRSWRAEVYAAFEKPHSQWQSRFNLPFKVTMSGSDQEVVIDGISLEVPPNHFGAIEGWLTRFPKYLNAAVLLIRTIEFAKFRIDEEIIAANEAVKIFVRER